MDEASAPHKRNRITLSCAPCRTSKLKCDRQQPCSQCSKKDRVALCTYTPKPEKKRPVKGMSARLKRLETMVRDMMEAESTTVEKQPSDAAGPHLRGKVVTGQDATTYVGATHCMAMLEDIEDIKSYFDNSEDIEEGSGFGDEIESTELLLTPLATPQGRQDLLSHLPERRVADRLISRYFAALSPSQHVIHRPAFTRAYARFWQDPSSASYHWIAQLFMMLGLGIFYNSFVNPYEVEGDSPLPTLDRVRHFRSYAGWALVRGKYTQPTPETIPAFLLYTESYFLFNRAAQMDCYILSGVCIRLMLKMGFHRDPSKLANISPFEGEMRRRMWNMALQVELLVSFHMGLPSLLQGVETDTDIPRNLQDDDFDEDSVDLPLGRPLTDYTNMTYPIYKTRLLRVFGHIARQAHALAPPSYAEVMKLDALLQDTWRSLPSFMHVRPLDECVGETPILLIQRFGLAAVYNKCRCVLHRRYLAEATPRSEHEYSRKQCLDAAMSLLNYQNVIWEATQPGHVLSQNGWFVSSLSVHDFLLAAMVLYLFVKCEYYPDQGDESGHLSSMAPVPSKAELINMIKRSHSIWLSLARNLSEVKKTAETLAVMLAKLGSPIEKPVEVAPALYPVGVNSGSSSLGQESIGPSSASPAINGIGLFSVSESGQNQRSSTDIDLGLEPSLDLFGAASIGNAMADGLAIEPSWMEAPNMDWRYLDISLAHSHDAGRNEDTGQTWLEKLPPAGDTDNMNAWL